MKRYLRLFIVILLVLCTKVNAEKLGDGFKNIPRDQMQPITLKKVLDIPKIEGMGSVQGITATDKYLIVVARKAGEDNDNALYVYDKNTFQLADLGTIENPVMHLDLGHGNDLTYNRRTNKIISTHNNKTLSIVSLDTFTVVETKTLESNVHAITYDYDKDLYYLAAGDTGIILDSNFRLQEQSFNLATNLTRQGMSYYKGLIYRSCYEAGSVTQYQGVYEGTLQAKEDLIYVVDSKGKLYNTLLIPITDTFSGGEIEGVTFINDKMFILYNYGGRGELYTPQYEENISVPLVLNVEVKGVNISSLTNKASLYDANDNLIETKELVNGKYIFSNRTFTKAGKTRYKIKVEQNNLVVSKGDLDFQIEVYYNPAFNRLEYKGAEFDTVTIEKPADPGPNPETGAKISILIILLIIPSYLLIIYLNRKTALNRI